jgi:PAS domain S-box-containing protein
MPKQRMKVILITAVASLVVLGAVMVLGSFVRGWMVHNLFDQYVKQEAAVANQVADDLKNEMAGVEENLKLAALLPAVQSTADPAACNAKLGEVFAVLGSQVGNLGRINARGVFACSVNKALIGVPGSKLGSYVTDIFNDPKHGTVLSHVILPPGATHAVALHVPVWNAKGQFDGTLGGAVYLRDLQNKFLKNVKFAENGFAVVFDDNGDVLFHPKAELIGKNLNSPEARAAFSNVADLQRAIAEAAAGHSGTVRYSLEGVPKVAAYRPVAMLPGRNWVVMATVPVADAAITLREVGVDAAYWWAVAIDVAALMALAITLALGTLRAIRLQESLRAEKAKAQTMLSSIGDGVVAIDCDWRIVLFNPAAEAITGWKEAEALGRPVREVMKLLDEQSRREHIDFIKETITTGRLHHMAQNTLLVKQDGSEVPVGDSAAPIFDAAGAVIGVGDCVPRHDRRAGGGSDEVGFCLCIASIPDADHPGDVGLELGSGRDGSAKASGRFSHGAGGYGERASGGNKAVVAGRCGQRPHGGNAGSGGCGGLGARGEGDGERQCQTRGGASDASGAWASGDDGPRADEADRGGVALQRRGLW